MSNKGMVSISPVKNSAKFEVDASRRVAQDMEDLKDHHGKLEKIHIKRC
jgi:hypothetical protein